ncbi:MAG: prephenate dehydrogenase [Pseudopedobacter saltans]|uniref:Prephenate dehydrogenase n=1 Tax=Pseudopedobacter saltans TaxID=151895 RepID=A0A2W5HCC9_9SPHI|nr:MAG: prephenate dehydrogenase [Pseudopedobacter saltans]
MEQQKPIVATTAIIGLGLIGGSMALALKDKQLTSHVIGTDLSQENAQKALELGLVDEVLPLKEAVQKADLVVLAVPVNACVQLLPIILDEVDKQIVFDTGSTKTNLVNAVIHHGKRSRYLPTHPMWGTEFSGPEAAVHGAFADKAVVFCNREESDPDVLNVVENIYKTIGMHIVHMQSEAHDEHVAYISHISHITSFALANTVLEKEKKEEAIFALASAGFESTVRLAKSPSTMWVPILLQNREHVLDVLNEHIAQLVKFRDSLENKNQKILGELMQNANKIGRVLKK